jgi:hypothetical protein
MPARINVVSGVSEGQTVWISQEVVRIGSGTGMDICIPSARVAERTATLEYRDGEYLVYNRTEEDLQLAGRNLEPRGVAAWPPGEQLMLPGDVRLLLEVEGTPEPAPAPQGSSSSRAILEELAREAEQDDSDGEEPATETGSPSRWRNVSPKLIVQWILIVCCVLGIVAAIKVKYFPTQTTGGDEGQPEVKLADIGGKLDDPKIAYDNGLLVLFRDLKLAESLRLRAGESSEARRELRRIRDELLRRENSRNPGESAEEAERLMLQYVTDRLAEANP